MTANADLIAQLPKAEIHIHIEGSLEPEMMFSLARRNEISLPFDSVEEIKKAYSFNNLQDFLDLYYQGMSVLQSEQDFYDLTRAYLERVQADNVRHTEIFFDPQGHLPRGVGFETCLDGIWRATRDCEDEHGLTSKLIMCFLRHLDEVEAEKTLDLALAHKDRITGVGLDSSELGHPPEKFKRVFRRARDEGFLLVAHAGEEGPPDYVWQALDVLGVDRIDHGNRALEDTALVKRLAADKMALTVCPLSNLRLCGISKMADHPIKQMLDAGLMATVNSDDPSYFGGYMNENFSALDEALGLAPEEILQLARNGFEAAFLDGEAKRTALEEFDSSIR
jgi:adenine deaminase